MSDNDSFIEEVTEEVRRDKLFAMFRKYGWIAGAVVVLVVGGAAYNEWRKASEMAAAQALGDSVLAAMEAEAAADRVKAIALVDRSAPQASGFLDLLEAATQAEASDRDASLALLDQVAGAADAPETYRELARLKAVILRGSDQDRAERLAILDSLAVPGKPFRVLALEQKALALWEFGNNDDAIAVLRTILDEPGATQGLLQRAQQLIVALGGDLSAEEDADSDNG